mmetsp:Transcript_14419/g.47813  ORF Transcript_14419/g.47813 Transcript_14419/m.47813 type:complete len:251 (-) Transcript_14419:625-1377(-)
MLPGWYPKTLTHSSGVANRTLRLFTFKHKPSFAKSTRSPPRRVRMYGILFSFSAVLPEVSPLTTIPIAFTTSFSSIPPPSAFATSLAVGPVSTGSVIGVESTPNGFKQTRSAAAACSGVSGGTRVCTFVVARTVAFTHVRNSPQRGTKSCSRNNHDAGCVRCCCCCFPFPGSPFAGLIKTDAPWCNKQHASFFDKTPSSLGNSKSNTRASKAAYFFCPKLSGRLFQSLQVSLLSSGDPNRFWEREDRPMG